jgi:putative tricarboxylic transport membrane protein
MPRDLVSGLFWLAIAIFAAAQGLSLKLGSLQRPGPGFFPFWGGVVLGLLSIVLVVRALTEPATAAERVRLRLESSKPVVALGTVLGYLLLLETLGFVAITFLLLLLLFRLERRAWAFSVASAVGGALASYALFQLWLQTQLPAGPFGF